MRAGLSNFLRGSWLLALSLALYSCGEQKAPAPQPATQSFPSSEATNATTVFLTGSIVTTRIKSGRIISYSDNDSAWGYVINVDFYNQEGKHTSTLFADSALVREKSRSLEGFGNVKIVTDDGRTLKSPHLAWDDKDRLITTDSLVVITRGADQMSGYGFSSDPELSHIRLKHQVRGTITDTKTLDDST